MEILEIVYQNLRQQASRKRDMFDNVFLKDHLTIKEIMSKCFTNRWIFYCNIGKIERKIYNLLICENLLYCRGCNIRLQISDTTKLIFSNDITVPKITHFEIIVTLIQLFKKLNRKLDGYLTYHKLFS